MANLEIQVPPTVVQGASIEIVGEAPGREEAESGMPFVGKSGKLLTRIITAAGYDRSLCTINNVVKRAPSGGFDSEAFRADFYTVREVPTYTKTGKLSKKTHKVIQRSEELNAYIDLLREELYARKPNIVVACGNEALSALCGIDGVLSYRGSVMESTLVPGLKVMPIVHPSWILSNAQWEYYYITVADFRKAVAESKYPDILRRSYESIIAPSLDTCIDYLRNLSDNPDVRWSFDIETRAGSIACMGFCAGTRALCIPFQTTAGPSWSPVEEAALLREISKVFARNPNLVGQNLVYDLDWMLDYGIEARDIYLDTMVGQFILAPEMPKGLDYIASLYTDAVYYKDEGKTWNSRIPDEQLWKYNCKDVWYTLWSSYAIEEQLRKQGKWQLWQDYGRKLFDIALEIQKRGVEVDRVALAQAQKIIMDEYERLRPQVVSAVGYEINVNSPKAVQDYLVNTLQLPLKRKRGTGKVTADEDALMSLLVKPLPKKRQGKVDPAYRDKIKLIMKERHLRKAGTYVGIKIQSGGDYIADPLFMDPDGVVRSMVNVAGTKTWRFSMSASPHGTGWNLQTAPKQLRCYKAPEGRIFLQPDQKQAEARVVAYLAQCKRQIELFNDPKWSIHMDLGRDVFKRELSKDSPEYTAAKSGVHGGNFRMMAERLAKTTGVAVEICELALEGYHRKYPEIRYNFHEGVKREIMEKGYLENPFGLRRYFFRALAGLILTGQFSNDDWNDACSWIPQSTVPFITNLTLINTCSILDYCWIHQQGHDAFLISVPEGCEEEAANVILAEGSKIKCHIHGRELVIPWEMTMGYTWGNMYEHYGRLPRSEWEKRVMDDYKAGKTLCEQSVLKGVYGVL